MFCANFRVAYFLLLRFIVGHLYQQIKSDMFVAAVFSLFLRKKEARKEILNDHLLYFFVLPAAKLAFKTLSLDWCF